MGEKKLGKTKWDKAKGFISITIVLLLFIGGVSMFSKNDYSKGEVVGSITSLTHEGIFNKTWEVSLNTGKISVSKDTYDQPILLPNEIKLSIYSKDNSIKVNSIIADVRKAMKENWRVRIYYNQSNKSNFLHCRGNTNNFISKIEFLEN